MTAHSSERPDAASAPPSAEPISHGAEDAWKALALVIDWIKHAETKAGLTLAAAGALAGILYALVKSEVQPSVPFNVAAAACTLLVTAAAFCSGMVLRPRLRSTSEPASLLYYEHITRQYRGRPDAFVERLDALVRNQDALIAEIAVQVWANAQVAGRKYRWSAGGILSLILALMCLALTTVIGMLT